jgi:hypothetical protein
MVKTNFQQMVRGMVLGSILICGLVVVSGCARGPEGPTGPAGATGAAGVSLLNEYTGTVPTIAAPPNNDYDVTVPEITGRRSSTYVEAYWKLSGSDFWTPMTDGWTSPLDSATPYTSRTLEVSWSLGQVRLAGVKTGDLYLIKVFENN